MTREPNRPLSGAQEPSRVDTQEILRQLHEQSRFYVAPIYWGTDEYDAHSVLHNGSCFVVEIDGFFVRNYCASCHQPIPDGSRFLCTHSFMRIRNLDILNWDDRQIDSHQGLDLVTFQISEKEVAEIDIRQFRFTSEDWPPNPPEIGRGVFFTGYAGKDRTVADRATLDFLQLSNGRCISKPWTPRIRRSSSESRICSRFLVARKFHLLQKSWAVLAVRLCLRSWNLQLRFLS